MFIGILISSVMSVAHSLAAAVTRLLRLADRHESVVGDTGGAEIFATPVPLARWRRTFFQ